mmetsp:Transcript_15800/g.22889  ORF Transcript_15800/g.22889 Transcript_15800/m.22889 type:complete len:374 (-) Transcript_15800:1420-2541(-)
MEFKVYDILSDFIEEASIPQCDNYLLIMSETCIIPDKLYTLLQKLSSDQDPSLGGKLYTRASNEFERGILLGKLSRCPNAKIVSPRPDVISKYIPNLKVEHLAVPGVQPSIKSSLNPEIPEFKPQVSFQNADSSFQKAESNLLKSIYDEVLNKYVEKFLKNTEIRATKIKSAKAQIKNLANGAITSSKKKVSDTTELPSPDDLAELIFEDLKKNNLVCESGNTFEFNDEKISQCFGPEKEAAFKSSLNKPGNSKPESPKPVQVSSDNRNTHVEPAPKQQSTPELVDRVSGQILASYEKNKTTQFGRLSSMALITLTKQPEIRPFSSQEKTDFLKVVLKHMFSKKLITYEEDLEINQLVDNYKSYSSLVVQINP